MSFSNKSISDSEYDRLINDSSTDVGIPEMVFKRNLFINHEDFIRKFGEYQRIYIKNGVQSANHKARAIESMLRLFNMVKFMIFQKKAWNKNYKYCFKSGGVGGLHRELDEVHKEFSGIITDFELMEKLDNGMNMRFLSYAELCELKDYCLWCLHTCNFTNLLLSNDRIDARAELRRDLGLSD